MAGSDLEPRCTIAQPSCSRLWDKNRFDWLLQRQTFTDVKSARHTVGAPRNSIYWSRLNRLNTCCGQRAGVFSRINTERSLPWRAPSLLMTWELLPPWLRKWGEGCGFCSESQSHFEREKLIPLEVFIAALGVILPTSHIFSSFQQ